MHSSITACAGRSALVSMVFVARQGIQVLHMAKQSEKNIEKCRHEKQAKFTKKHEKYPKESKNTLKRAGEYMDFGVQNAKMSAKRCEKEAEQSNTKKQQKSSKKQKKKQKIISSKYASQAGKP